MLLSINVPNTAVCSTESCQYFIFQNLNAGRPQMDSLIAALSGAFVPDTKLCLFAFPVDRLNCKGRYRLLIPGLRMRSGGWIPPEENQPKPIAQISLVAIKNTLLPSKMPQLV